VGFTIFTGLPALAISRLAAGVILLTGSVMKVAGLVDLRTEVGEELRA